MPLGEVNQGDATYLVRSQGQFTSLDDIRNLVVHDARGRAGLPARHRRGARTRPRTAASSCASTAGRASACRSTSSRARTRSPSRRASRPRSSASTARCPASACSSANDQSRFIEQAIHNVQEHALIGGVLVVLIIFAFLRDFRSTLIVCTSIPVSVIGTFALLYFGGFTLNTMTFGGLALGIGMIVDAAIVVLENTHRHLHMGKDRMTAAIDGSEEVWSAILASTLTHIAVFIPLLFLVGHVEHPVHAALGRRDVLAGDVAVRGGHDRAGALLALAAHAGRGSGSAPASWRASTASASGSSSAWTRATARLIHLALAHRPTVIAGAAASGRRRRPALPAGRHRAAAADRRGRGQRQRRARRRHARRAHRRRDAPARGDGQGVRARGDDAHHQRRRRRRRRLRRRRRQPPRPDQHPAGAARRAHAHQRRDRAGPAAPARRACPASSSAPTRPAATSSSTACSAAATTTAGSRSRSAATTSTTPAGSRRKRAR